MSRQVGYLDDDEDDDGEDEEDTDEPQRPVMNLAGVYKDDPPAAGLEEHEYVGLNGRCNKPVDTCYSFWVSASLSVMFNTLNMSDLVLNVLNHSYLEKTRLLF